MAQEILNGKYYKGTMVFPLKALIERNTFAISSSSVPSTYGDFRYSADYSPWGWRTFIRPSGLPDYPLSMQDPDDPPATGSIANRFYAQGLNGTKNEVLVLMRASTSNPCYAGFRADGSANGIVVQATVSGFRLVEWFGSSVWNGMSTADGKSVTTGDWWWIRVTHEGSSYSYRAWQYGSPEPVEWDATATSTYISTSNYPALVMYDNPNFQNNFEVAWFSASNGSVSAPTQYQTKPRIALVDTPEQNRVAELVLSTEQRQALRVSSGAVDHFTDCSAFPNRQVYTACCWFKLINDRAGVYRFIIDIGISAGSYWQSLGWHSNNNFEVNTYLNGDLDLNNEPQEGDWIFCYIRRDGDTYWAGVAPEHGEISEGTETFTTAFATLWVRFGNNGFNEYVDGLIQDAAIWDRCLSRDEIEQVRHKGPLNIKRGLFRYYPMNGYSSDALTGTQPDTLASNTFVAGIPAPNSRTLLIPIEENLPELAEFDEEWTEQPPGPVR